MDFEEIENGGFRSVYDSWDDETADRAENSKNIISFGIDYLDHSLDGIEMGDFIVLGAPSGGGKTQAVMAIALKNALEGRKVYFFALEAERYEISRRIKYSLYARFYFEDKEREPINGMRFSQFRLNRYIQQFAKYDHLVKLEKEKLKTLFVFYRSSSFGVHDFISKVTAIKKQAQLVVLDHLNYFDFDSDKENQAVSDAVKAIRVLQVDLKIPIIMVAHIRKKGFGDKSLVPSIEDFHGSSDIYKNATKCVMIAPCFDVTGNNRQYRTYIQAGKQRADGSVSRFLGLCTYDISANAYLHNYELGTLDLGRSRFSSVDQKQMPPWASSTPTPKIQTTTAAKWEK